MRHLSLHVLFLATLCVFSALSHRNDPDSISIGQPRIGNLPRSHPSSVKHHGLEGFDTGDEEDPSNQLRNENFVRNAEHIKAHLKGVVSFDPETASPQELDFHFFKIQDTSRDNRLDGLELMAAIHHGLEDEYEAIEGEDITEDRKDWKRRVLKNKAWVAVDRILREDDKNNDGYITYDEYAVSRRASKEMRDSIV